MGFQRSAMSGRIDPAGQATDNAIAAAGQPGGETLGLCDAILGSVTRSDHGDRQPVTRKNATSYKQNARRIGNGAERRRIVLLRLNENAHAVLATVAQRVLDIDFAAGGHDAATELLPDTG